jgi:predicted Zn-dependent protease
MIADAEPALDEVLAELGAPAMVEVLDERQELLRFGASRITYQHSEQQLRVRVLLIRAGRAAWGVTSTLDLPAMRSFRAQLEDIVTSLPEPVRAARLPTHASTPRAVRTSFESTSTATSADRAAALREALTTLPAGTELGGSIAHRVIRHTVASTAQPIRSEERTRALMHLVASRAGQSSYARALHRDWSAIDRQAALEAVAAALEPLPLRGLATSQSFRAVLAPQATITLLATLGQVAFGGQSHLGGASAFSGCLGHAVLSPLIDLIDDGCDADGLPTTFDCEGAPKQRVELVCQGVLRGLVHDSPSATAAGLESTGHAVPPGWRFGADALPSHLLLAPGQASDADLIVACERGLFIQRVDYVRVVHARETLVTGSTRDATLWIERGRVVARVPQFRFTLRLADLFSASRLVALGARRERGETPFMESVVAPGALVAAFPID